MAIEISGVTLGTGATITAIDCGITIVVSTDNTRAGGDIVALCTVVLVSSRCGDHVPGMTGSYTERGRGDNMVGRVDMVHEICAMAGVTVTATGGQRQGDCLAIHCSYEVVARLQELTCTTGVDMTGQAGVMYLRIVGAGIDRNT